MYIIYITFASRKKYFSVETEFIIYLITKFYVI